MTEHNAIVSLRDYLESRIQAVERSIDIASAAMSARLEGMNEFRDTLRDQAGRFVTRAEMDDKIDSIHRQLKELQLHRATLDGKASQTQALIILVIAVAGLVMSFIGLFVRN